jgi:Protein of unknown function (DUF3102)
MSETVPLKSAAAAGDDLSALAGKIRTLAAAVRGGGETVIRKAIDIGVALIDAKRQVPHGQWLPWIKDECELSERTVQDYMLVAACRHKIEQWMKSATAADLTLRGALRAAKGRTSNKGCGPETTIARAQQTLIKNLREMLPDHAVAAAERTITELQAVLSELKPAVKQAA